jgi:hypothetical protein
MATLARPRPPLNAEGKFFTGMAAAMLVTVFVGFAPTYYLLPWFNGVTTRGVAGAAALTPLVHVHALVFSGWLILFIAQTGLVAARRTDIHRALGGAGLALAGAVTVIGLVTAISAGRRGSSPPGWDDRAFLLVPVTSVLLFAGFVAAGFVRRRRADWHKRLMLLGTIAMLVPALARIMNMIALPFLPRGVAGGLILVNLFLLALIAFDLKRLRRVHPATLWGIAIFLITWPARLMLGETGPWQAFAAALIG